MKGIEREAITGIGDWKVVESFVKEPWDNAKGCVGWKKEKSSCCCRDFAGDAEEAVWVEMHRSARIIGVHVSMMSQVDHLEAVEYGTAD